MSENPQENITLEPEFSIIIFGNGYIALSLGGVEEVDNQGRTIVNFVIKPSSPLRKRYNIKDSELDSNGNIKFKAYKKDLIAMNQYDDANRRILYIKTYTHDETEVSRINWNTSTRLEQMEMRVAVLEGELIWLSEQLQLAKTNPAEFVSQGLEIFDKISTNLVNLANKKPDKEN